MQRQRAGPGWLVKWAVTREDDGVLSKGTLMRIQRSLAVAFILSQSVASLLAQAEGTATEGRTDQIGGVNIEVLHDQPKADEARFTVWVLYPERDGEFTNHQQYLPDLAARFRDKGLAIGIVLPRKDAERTAKDAPRLVVATPSDKGKLDNISGMLCQIYSGTGGLPIVNMQSLDTLVDSIDACLDGSFDPAAYTQAEQTLNTLLGGVADGGQFAALAKRSVTMWPRSGRARACVVLEKWWCQGDLAGANKAVDEGIKALSNEAVPMATFVDLVLRGNDPDKKFAQQMAMAMVPVAAGAPDGIFTQLVNLRALLLAGQDRVAGRIVATLPKRVAGRPTEQLILAETLMDSHTPAAFRDIAERLVQNADANGGHRKWVYATRHKILKRCGDDKAAEQLMDAYRAKNLGSGLNNDAWYTIVQPPTMGRFDTLALAQCEEMQRVEQLDYGSLDTVALAHFVNGKVVEAIEMQTKAAQQSQNDPVYVARLRRYKETQAAMAARAAKTKAKDAKRKKR